MQEEKKAMQQQIQELQDKIERLEYIIQLYENGDSYRRELKAHMEARISYLEAITPENRNGKTKIISISNIRKIR